MLWNLVGGLEHLNKLFGFTNAWQIDAIRAARTVAGFGDFLATSAKVF